MVVAATALFLPNLATLLYMSLIIGLFGVIASLAGILIVIKQLANHYQYDVVFVWRMEVVFLCVVTTIFMVATTLMLFRLDMQNDSSVTENTTEEEEEEEEEQEVQEGDQANETEMDTLSNHAQEGEPETATKNEEEEEDTTETRNKYEMTSTDIHTDDVDKKPISPSIGLRLQTTYMRMKQHMQNNYHRHRDNVRYSRLGNDLQ
jgi:hypothetical protein